jgi:hypothetical protein
VVGGGVPSITGDSCVIGWGGCSGGSDPIDAGGIVGPFAESSKGAAGMGTFARGEPSAVRIAFTATCRPGAGAALTGTLPFKLLMLDPTGIRFEVLAPGAGAAGTGPAGPVMDGNAACGANPPAGPIPTAGWLENCGVLPIGAARADGSPCGGAAGVVRCAQPELAGVAAVGKAVGGLIRVVAVEAGR